MIYFPQWHCLGLSCFWSFFFLWDLCFPHSWLFQQASASCPSSSCIFGAECCDAKKLWWSKECGEPSWQFQCHTWQGDFCSSAFLLFVGEIISPGLFAETACSTRRGSRKEGETEEEMWNKGGFPAVLHLCVRTWEILSCCCSSSSGSLGKAPCSHLPFLPWDEWMDLYVTPRLHPAIRSLGNLIVSSLKDCPDCERKKSYGHK